MAWCGQATSHYLSQCWPRSMSPNSVTRPQWVNNNPQAAGSINNLHAHSLVQNDGPERACWSHSFCLKSLAPGKSECDSKNVIFNLVLLIGIFRSSHGNALPWMPQDLTDDKSTLVRVMAWCLQAPSYYLSQCWLSSLSPYGVPRPQWVNKHFKETDAYLC